MNGLDARQAAVDAWQALERSSMRRRWGRWGRRVVTEGPGERRQASLWSLVHVMAAANDLAALGHDPGLARLLRMLPPYRADEAYLPTPGARLRYLDDNAWLGLLSLRIADRTDEPSHRRRAERVATFLRRHEHPDGGLPWREGHDSRNACSAAPAAELVVALAIRPQAASSGDRTDDDAVAFGLRQAAWLDDTLRREDGLVADRIERGVIEPTAWSYNQGAACGLHRLLAEAGQGSAHRARAIELAHTSLDVIGAARLWTEPPPFLAIWFRELLALTEVADDARVLLRRHAERLLRDARDPVSGLFTSGGAGSYDGRPTIDQAAVVQLLALAAGAPPMPAGSA